MPAFHSDMPVGQMPGAKEKTGRVKSRKIVAAAGIVGALFFTSACSSSEAASPASTTSASAAASSSATPSPTASFPYTLPNGLIAKGIANDGKGDYIQTSIADTDPAMQYNPAITDDAAKAHYSEAELAEAQKVIVRFIAEEVIDSTLNGGSDVDGWWAAHKDQVHPLNQDLMLNELKSVDKSPLARESWIATRPGYSYLHGTDTPRIKSRNITPNKLRYVTSSTLQGVMLDTNTNWSMEVTGGKHTGVQSTNATASVAVAKDAADGKWKVAGYQVDVTTAEG
jgi:hypothetical protein